MVGSSIITRGSGFQYTPIVTRGYGQLVEIESVALTPIRGKSAIITRGYGYRRSTIITRGYARIARLIEEAVVETVSHARFVRGKSTKATRSRFIPDYILPDKNQYNDEKISCDIITVSVELVGLHGKDVFGELQNEITKSFTKNAMHVHVTDMSVAQHENTTQVTITLVEHNEIERNMIVTAKLK